MGKGKGGGHEIARQLVRYWFAEFRAFTRNLKIQRTRGDRYEIYRDYILIILTVGFSRSYCRVLRTIAINIRLPNFCTCKKINYEILFLSCYILKVTIIKVSYIFIQAFKITLVQVG